MKEFYKRTQNLIMRSTKLLMVIILLCSGQVLFAQGKSYTEQNITIGLSGAKGVPGGSGDTEAPTPPTTLKCIGSTNNQISLSWDASTDNVGVVEYYVYQGSNLVDVTTVTASVVTGLSPHTTYTFCVKARDAVHNFSECSNEINASTQGYCTLKGLDQSYEYIDLVKLGDIDRTSGSDGGYFLSNQTTTLKMGSTYNISYSTNASQYTECWTIWIDYNMDEDFYDEGERIVTNCIKDSEPVTSTFTVPFGDLRGRTRMRVSMSYNDSPMGCGIIQYGEVEDYDITIEKEMCNAWSDNSLTYIENVKLGSIDNNSGASSYTDYTNLSTLINNAETFKLEVKVGNGFIEQIGALVFIDWNNDLDFNDQDENYLMNWDTWTTKTLSLNFNIPSNTELGMKYMRIRLYSSSDIYTACGMNTNGEVEDYSLNYKWQGVPGPMAVSEERETQLLVSPNPAHISEELTVTYDSEAVGLTYINIYDISGNMVLKTAVDKSQQILTHKIASRLPTGTYIVQVVIGDESNTKKIRVE